MDFRMGKPVMRKLIASVSEHIRYGRERRELKHLSTCRKRKKVIDFLSSGERKGQSPNRVWKQTRGMDRHKQGSVI